MLRIALLRKFLPRLASSSRLEFKTVQSSETHRRSVEILNIWYQASSEMLSELDNSSKPIVSIIKPCCAFGLHCCSAMVGRLRPRYHRTRDENALQPPPSDF